MTDFVFFKVFFSKVFFLGSSLSKTIDLFLKCQISAVLKLLVYKSVFCERSGDSGGDYPKFILSFSTDFFQ